MSRLSIAEKNAQKKTNWGKASFTIQNSDDTPFTITVSGRERWALESLMRANEKGCTPIDTPGPRWSAYVFDLRQVGVEIETQTEPHQGPFAGTHARYILHSKLLSSQSSEVAA